jgi:hypothetical protein
LSVSSVNIYLIVTDIIWILPEGREPNEGDWQDTGRRCVGWIMNGNAIGELSETGGKIVGDTLLVLLNGQFESITINHHISLNYYPILYFIIDILL